MYELVILTYLREGFPGPTPFKHMESKVFDYTLTLW